MGFLSVCTALYAYAPQGEGELALEEGDLVYVLEKSDEDDWWKAKKRAASDEEEEPVGLVPNNYVEEAQPTHQAKALYDYSRQTDEELSFGEDAILSVYDNTSDPEWTLAGLDGDFGFVPANYIEITGKVNQEVPSPAQSSPITPPPDETRSSQPPAAKSMSSGPASAIAGIMQGKSGSAAEAPLPALPQRHQQLTPEASEDEDAPGPALPQRPRSEQMSPPATQYATPRVQEPAGVAASPPHNRVVHQDDDEPASSSRAGGFRMYNISEMVSAMGKQKKLPTTLGLNLATGVIMIAPEKSRDGPTLEWTADKLTHYSIESKHVFVELIRPSKSIDFHAGTKDTAQEIVRGLGEIAGAARAEGLREVLEAAGGTSQKKGKMLYDFVAQGDDEVTVGVDDEVVVLDDSKSEEWWMVRRLKNGMEGVVPSSYVEVTALMSPPPPPKVSNSHAGKSFVEQNRLEEERLTKEAMKASKNSDVPARGSSLAGDGGKMSSRSKRESKHGRTSSSTKSKPDTSKVRTWTDRSGNFKVEAQFLGLKDGKIHLHKLNGVKIAVPAGKMALEDLEYVEAATGQSLDDEKPLSDIKRRSTQKVSGSAPKSGASFEKPKPPPKEEPEYDWFDFFLKCGVPYQLCERYAYNFKKDSMDESILTEITPSVLRTLGLKEGDILRVTKYLDTKYSRNTTEKGASSDAGGGLFSGPGGTLRNNTRKGRPAPAVESKDVVDENAFRARQNGDEDDNGPPPPQKDRPGFENDAWTVKPARQASQPVSDPGRKAEPQRVASPPAPTPSTNVLDLAGLSAPLEPTRAAPPTQQPQQQQQQQQPASMQPQPTGASPQFFSQLASVPGQQQQPPLLNQPQQNQFSQQSQQIGPPRQRPQAPQIQQGSSLIPPPPARPLSAPQTQPQNTGFAPSPLQPQLTGFQPQTQLAPPGQSLSDLNQQRLMMQQQQMQQQQQQQQYAQLQPQQTGYMPIQNPYVNGQLAGSPFADPRLQPMQPQQTGYQPSMLQPQQTGYQPLQPQATGINSFLPPALQPQPTGALNGFGRPAFGQSPPPMPPMPQQQQQQPSAQPLVPQKTGPAPSVRFGTASAKALVAQPTGKRANLSNATPSNPFGF